MLNDVTVIIPVAARETVWRNLLGDLAPLSPQAEVLLMGVGPAPDDFAESVAVSHLACCVRWQRTEPGRAHQQNVGAQIAARSFLWFLHADTRLMPDAIAALEMAIDRFPTAIHFFDLTFACDGPRLMMLNAWGAYIRSRVFRLPFGDQGLSLAKSTFHELNGFDEQVPYGEDHHLIWRAHRARVRVLPVGAEVATSARKYEEQGWLATTMHHLSRTARQALPQLAGLIVDRCRKSPKQGPREVRPF
jgi:hypothetical protein